VFGYALASVLARKRVYIYLRLGYVWSSWKQYTRTQTVLYSYCKLQCFRQGISLPPRVVYIYLGLFLPAHSRKDISSEGRHEVFVGVCCPRPRDFFLTPSGRWDNVPSHWCDLNIRVSWRPPMEKRCAIVS